MFMENSKKEPTKESDRLILKAMLLNKAKEMYEEDLRSKKPSREEMIERLASLSPEQRQRLLLHHVA